MSFQIALLFDNFEDATISPLWSLVTAGSGTTTETGGDARCNLPSSTAGSHDAYFRSTGTYDLTGASCTWNIDTMVATGVAATAYLQLLATGVGQLLWRQVSNTLTARHVVGAVDTQVYSATWNSSTYKYLRIRESAGTVYWESSSNGTAWTTRHSMAAPIGVTALAVQFGASCGNVASPGSLRIEEINAVYPAPSATWRETTADWGILNRFKPVTLASDGGKQGVLVTADTMDEGTRALGGTVRYFAGPLGSSSGGYLQLTEYASLVLAQASPFPIPVNGRVDLPALVDARYMRLYHRSVDASAHTVYEFVPRRMIQADDIEAESIRAINISAGAVTADKIFVLDLSAITATIGQLTIASSQGLDAWLYQGTGTGDVPTTGLKLFNSGGIGKLSTYNATVEQVTLDTDGKLKAGAGAVRMDAGGIEMDTPSSATTSIASYKLVDGANITGALNGFKVAGAYFTFLETPSNTGSNGSITVRSLAPTTKIATTTITAIAPGKSATVTLTARDSAALSKVAIQADTTDIENSVNVGTVSGGLNVGSATGAGAGEIRASDKLRLNGVTDMSAQMRSNAIVNNATAQFANAATELGLAIIADSTGGVAIFTLLGAGHGTVEVSDASGVYSVTAGTGSSTNIYWSAGNSRYEIENKRGSTITYHVWLFV